MQGADIGCPPHGIHREWSVSAGQTSGAGRANEPIPTLVASGAPVQAARTRAIRTLVVGAVLATFGLIVSVATYAAASSNPNGGSYYVAFGPIIFGIVLIVRGARGLERRGPGPRP